MKPNRIPPASSLHVFTIVAMLLASVPCQADLPGAKDQNAYTLHDYAKEMLAFHRHTMEEAYNKVGKRDERWDAAVLKFLDALAQNFTYHTLLQIYQPREYPSHEQCLALARAAIEQGCHDPLVLSLHARV